MARHHGDDDPPEPPASWSTPAGPLREPERGIRMTGGQVGERYPELADWRGWQWNYLASVDLLVGYRPGPVGVATCYVDSTESAAVWLPQPAGDPVELRGRLAELTDALHTGDGGPRG